MHIFSTSPDVRRSSQGTQFFHLRVHFIQKPERTPFMAGSGVWAWKHSQSQVGDQFMSVAPAFCAQLFSRIERGEEWLRQAEYGRIML